MTPINIREMRPDEVPVLVRWLYKHRQTNLVDMEVFRKNQVRVYVAEKGSEIICFMPIKFVYWFEAAAPNPDAQPSEIGAAFSAMNDYLIKEAHKENIGSAVVQPNDEKFSEFVQTHFNYAPVVRETLEFNFNAGQESAKCV